MLDTLQQLIHELYDVAAGTGVDLSLTIEEGLIMNNIELTVRLIANTLVELSSYYKENCPSGYVSTIFGVSQPLPPAEFLCYKDLWDRANAQILTDKWNLCRQISNLSIIPKQKLSDAGSVIKSYRGDIVYLRSNDGMDYYSVTIKVPDCQAPISPILYYGIDAEQFVRYAVQMLATLLYAVINAVKRIRSGMSASDAAEDLYITISHLSPIWNYASAVIDTCDAKASIFSASGLYMIPFLARRADSAEAAIKSMLEKTVVVISRLLKELLSWKQKAEEYMHQLKSCTEALQIITDTFKRELELYNADCSKLIFWYQLIKLDYPEYYEKLFEEEML